MLSVSQQVFWIVRSNSGVHSLASSMFRGGCYSGYGERLSRKVRVG